MLFLRSGYPNGATLLDGDFKWRYEVGSVVEADNWVDGDPFRGKGLHGLMNGEGDYAYLRWSRTKTWMVCETDHVTMLKGAEQKKPYYKGQTMTVKYVGDREGAANYIISRLAQEGKNGLEYEIHGATRTQTSPDNITSNGGAASRLTLGNNCQSKVGFRSFVQCGHDCHVVADNESYLSGGDRCTLIGDNYVTLFGGDGTQAVAGYDSLVVGGDYSTLGGYDKTQIYSGDNCKIKIRNFSRVQTGEFSTVEAGHFNDIITGPDCHVLCDTRCKLVIGPRTTFQAGAGSEILAFSDDGSLITGYTKHLELTPYTKYRLNGQKEFEEVTT